MDIILGADVSLTCSAFAVVAFVKGRKPRLIDIKEVKTTADQPMAERLFQIAQEAAAIARAHGVRLAGVEKGFVRHMSVSLKLAEARGAVLAALYANGCKDIRDVNNKTAKAVICGDHKATKDDMAAAVKRKVVGLPREGLSHDESDAVGVALTLRKAG